MPQTLRIALSDSMSYDGKLGGSKANFNFSKFKKLKANKTLGNVFKIVKDVKENGNHVTELLSLADIIQIGGASAVEYCGGPFINVKIGRKNLEEESEASENSYYPHVDMNLNEIRNVYKDYNLHESEVVALLGHRTLGFFSNKDDEKEQRWTRNPWVFDNNYYQELLDNKSPYLKTDSDKALLTDDHYMKWVVAFAEDQDMFFDSFKSAYEKIGELGHGKLLDEDASIQKINYV